MGHTRRLFSLAALHDPPDEPREPDRPPRRDRTCLAFPFGRDPMAQRLTALVALLERLHARVRALV